MNRLYIVITITTTILFASCNKVEVDNNASLSARTITMSISASTPSSKVTIGEKENSTYPVSWDDEDESVYLGESLVKKDGGTTTYTTGNKKQSSGYTLDDDGKAHFIFELNEKTADGYIYYFISPSSSVCNFDAETDKNFTLTLPSDQTPTESSVDPAAAILFAKSNEQTTQGGSIGADFSSILAYGKMTIKDLPSTVSSNNETIQSITIATSDTPMAGTFNYYYDNTTNPISVTSGSNSIVVDVSQRSLESAEFDVWFACLPLEVATGKSLTFTLTTDKNVYTKTTSALSKAMTFTAGNVLEFNVSLTSATKEDYSGTYVALVNNSGTDYWALSSIDDGASTKRLKAVSVSYSGTGDFSTANENVIWTVSSSGAGYTFNNGSQYLSWSSGNNAKMITSPYLLSLIKNSDGTFYIKSNENPKRILAKYNSSAYFAFYEGTQSNIFRLVPAINTAPVINLNASKIYVQYTQGTAQISYEIKNSVSGKSISAISSDDDMITEFDYQTENVLKFTVSTNNNSSERTCTITVKYDGAKDETFEVIQGAYDQSLVLDFKTKAKGHSSYEDSWSYVDNWIITNGANSNKSWEYIKLGAKNIQSTESHIVYKPQINGTVSKVSVHVPAGSLSKDGMSVNNWGLYVYSDADMKTLIECVTGGEISKSESTFEFTPSSENSWKNCYIKVSWNMTNTTSTNGIVCVDTVTILFK